MRFAGVASCLAAALWPLPLSAHDAFGDLGPLYQAMLHPVVDPLQGLLVVGAAVFLSRQPLPVVQLAYPAFGLAALFAILAASALSMGGIDPRILAVFAAAIGLMAATGLRPGPVPTVVIFAAVGLAAGSVVDPAQDLYTGALIVVGSAIGVMVAALLLWGISDLAIRRLSPVAPAVVGGWVAAVGLMLAAMPA